MANFNWLQQWSEHGRKNGHSVFDLSKKMCFHLPNSLIVPIRFIETVPDDHFNINMSGLLRSMTMNKAAFYQGKAVFSAFFVPYKQLWHNFNQFVVIKQDKHSSTLKGSNYAPIVNLYNLITTVLYYKYYEIKDEFGYPLAYNSARLLQFCKIFNFYPLFDIVDKMPAADKATFADMIDNLAGYIGKFEDKYVNMWRLLAYQHIFYDFYRNKYYDDLPFFQPTGDDEPQCGYIDVFNVDDVPCKTNVDCTFAMTYDSWNDVTHEFSDFEGARSANLLSLHYCQYRKDLYTSLLPSTQFGAVSGLDFNGLVDLSNVDVDIAGSPLNDIPTNSDDGRWTDGTLDFISGYTVQTRSFNGSNQLKYKYDGLDRVLSHNHTVDPAEVANRLVGSLGDNAVAVSSFDVLELRRAELLQQWKQNALRAGNMVDDNFRSHYGVEPYYEDDNNVRFLGQFECRMDVNPVTATADSTSGDNGNVGDIAAYGVGNIVGRPLDVQIKDFGVIVICAHFASEVYYSANGIDKQNTLIEPLDYFQSEFDNAGLDSVAAWQQSTGVVGGNDENVLDMSFGFTPPYTFHKTEVDEVFGEYGDMLIADNEVLDDWQGSLGAWTVRRSDLLVDDGGSGDFFTTSLPLTRFYQSPKLTNSIFGVAYDGKGDTDPFGFAVNIECKAIRPMSVLGIPIFG